MKKDIRNRRDIARLVGAFYDKVKKDELIGFFFSEVVPVDWEQHLPLMVDFWDNVLFFSGTYSGNPMQIHMRLHQKHRMEMTHFIRWNKLFNETVDEMFAGEQAETIKQRAASISTVIQIKLFK